MMGFPKAFSTKGRSGAFRGTVLGLIASAMLMLAPSQGKADTTLSVIATTGMIGDVVRNVAGERAEVRQLMGAGVDPHLYKATRSDIAGMLRADVVFYNGLLLEGKMTDALVRVATAGKPVFAVTELIDQEYLLEPPEFEGLQDPHVWMDPSAWKKAVEVIRDRLAEVDPEYASQYEDNAKVYLSELDKLDAYAEASLKSIPDSQRLLVTAHDAFNYFGQRYAFEVMGIQGMSTESEAGVKRIEELVNVLVERDVPAVFVESTIPDRNVRALIAGASARGHEVVIGGELFSDAMGAPGTYEGTYLGMIDHNVTTLVRALGGDAPEHGLHGKLAAR